MNPHALLCLGVLILAAGCTAPPPQPAVGPAPASPPQDRNATSEGHATVPETAPTLPQTAEGAKPHNETESTASRTRPLTLPKGRPPMEAVLPPALQAQGIVEVYVGIGGTVRHDHLLEGQLRIYGEGNRTAAVKVAMVGDGRAKLEVDGEPWPILEAGEEHENNGVYVRVQRVMSR